MGLLRFIFSRSFLKNLLIALLFLLVVPAIGYLLLNWYTAHGENTVVPDVRGLELEAAGQTLDETFLQYLVVDSVFFEGGTPGAVFEQNPPPFAEVKENRVVYLTVYRSTPPAEAIKVEEGMSERVAEIILQNKGFKFEKQYEDHVYLAGMVVKVMHRGKVLQANDQLVRGEKVVLVIGKRSDERISVPDLRGLSLDSAQQVLNRIRLSVGTALYDRSVETEQDSLDARVYKQLPAADDEKPIPVGTPIDLFLGLIVTIEPAVQAAPTDSTSGNKP